MHVLISLPSRHGDHVVYYTRVDSNISILDLRVIRQCHGVDVKEVKRTTSPSHDDVVSEILELGVYFEAGKECSVVSLVKNKRNAMGAEVRDADQRIVELTSKVRRLESATSPLRKRLRVVEKERDDAVSRAEFYKKQFEDAYYRHFQKWDMSSEYETYDPSVPQSLNFSRDKVAEARVFTDRVLERVQKQSKYLKLLECRTRIHDELKSRHCLHTSMKKLRGDVLGEAPRVPSLFQLALEKVAETSQHPPPPPPYKACCVDHGCDGVCEWKE